jgi:hypothetical protein
MLPSSRKDGSQTKLLNDVSVKILVLTIKKRDGRENTTRGL